MFNNYHLPVKTYMRGQFIGKKKLIVIPLSVVTSVIFLTASEIIKRVDQGE